MPCQRCGARQVDPSRGPSAWKRAVSGGEQVLICPTCQRDAGWQTGVDRCPACGGIRLSKTLGVLKCSSCRWSGDLSGPLKAPEAPDGKLADEVSAALGRVFGSQQSSVRDAD